MSHFGSRDTKYILTTTTQAPASLFKELLDVGIRATGTLRTNRTEVPSSIVALKQALENKTEHGTGYHIRDPSSDIAYVCWRDVFVVTILSTVYPGHREATVTRTTCVSGQAQKLTIPINAVATCKYNISMGGVDKSNQLLSYHNVLCRIVCYWKTLFYHGVNVGVVNSFIL